jgi:hypothetical protein
MKNYYEIIKESDLLTKAFKFILENSNSLYLSYHNLNHNLNVLKYCYDNLDFEKLLDTNESECLLLTAIFHDYNHSGGKLNDNENIRNAYVGLMKFININKFDIDLKLCERYLIVTQFPYIVETENIYDEIIRDSDLCGIFEPNFLQAIVFGLKQEMNINDMNKLCTMELNFLNNIKFQTEYCNKLYSEKIQNIINEVEFLHNLYK